MKAIQGNATKTAEIRNGISDPSLNTLIARSGTQPMIEVLRPINATVISDVRMTVALVN